MDAKAIACRDINFLIIILAEPYSLDEQGFEHRFFQTFSSAHKPLQNPGLFYVIICILLEH